MKDGPTIASIAALIGDPARANILTALMDGRALTVSELAEAAGVTLQTASGHLSKLTEARLLTVEKQGRHRYLRLSGNDVAQVLEQLMGLAQRAGATRVRTGPNDHALRQARICYDHLAGEAGVVMLGALAGKGFVTSGAEIALTDAGRVWFEGFGIAVADLEGARRPVCLHCLDWSERRHHLAGALGSAMLDELLHRDWLRRGPGRTLQFTPTGRKAFAAEFAG
jgi:DNA-binding transcriptional ArsR family regulator